ncbi:MAG: spore germination protein [Lachnospiraceae bacterium]|nr:spore germination protein [Lachnospiraceae bacterium]
MQITYNKKNEIDLPVYESLQDNIDALESIFAGWGDIVKKRFIIEREGKNIGIYIIYIDGLTDNEMVERTITRPLMYEWRGRSATGSADVFDTLFHRQTEAVDMVEKETIMDVLDAVLKGDTAIFVDGAKKAMLLSTKKLPTRAVNFPQKEAGLKGPRDSFLENFRINTALLRRRIKDPKMKLKQGFVGQRTRTLYGLMYMEDLVYPSLLENIEKKLHSFDIDGILDCGMLLHLIEEKWYSPFPQVQTTERPDKAASAIMEGRVVVVVDNSPEVLILPTTWNTFFQAADDYYNRFAVGTFARILRYLAAFITVLLPGLYIAITCYYPQVLPADFILAIAGARSNVTFPIVVEVLLMELLFELLREAGIRLPGQMGNTIGVVGGLIVGQSAVEASLVSTIVVIVVALSAIASFSIPNEDFASTFRLLKFVMIALGAVWGLYGIMLGVLVVQIHLASLESFGIPYMMPLVSGSIDNEEGYQDYVMRKPVFTMYNRPLFARRGHRRRFRGKKED